MITPHNLAHILEGITALGRFGKNLSPEALQFAFLTLPESVRQELTQAHLLYAAQQLLLDRDRPDGIALHMQLLRYLYPCDGDAPRPDRGLRSDLRQRMAASGSFQPLAPPPPEQRIFLPPAPIPDQGPVMTRAERIAHLERLAAQTGVTNPRQPAPLVPVEA